MDDNENSAYHRPVWNDDGRFYYEIIPQAKAKNYVAVCLKPADKVIPVIFIPGVMGSNLKNGKSKVWQFSFSSLKKWPLAGPEKRKFLLDPQTTMVDDSGKILNNGADGKKFPSRRKRGWGSAFYKSYGEALDRLQYLLSDDDILMDNYFRKMQLQTVPVTAIRTTSPRIRGILATDVDHEGAYAVDPVDRSRSVYRDLSDALMFTVRSVVKIVQQVPAP
ncbi:hypothetical protein [Rosenbergiella nectarea]|uniref:hypothetical protein n=1 Tax=Rosenbergiella nectarea TaxID=988801 RepID=UPI001F4DD712|nr:hypothetical protein [Rosenbergiella nectarea]